MNPAYTNPFDDPDTLSRINKLITLGPSGGFGFSTSQDLQHLRDLQDGLCYFCAIPLVSGEYDLDHLQPLCDVGTNWPDNLAYTCRPCNAKKHFRTERQYWNILKKERGTGWVASQRKRIAVIRPARRAMTAARLVERWEAMVEFHHRLTTDVCACLGLDEASSPVPRINLHERWFLRGIGPMTKRFVWEMEVRVGRRSVVIGLPTKGRRSLRIWYSRNRDALVDDVAAMVTQATGHTR